MCHTFQALGILFSNPYTMDRNAVSHCSGLQYQETFQKSAHDAMLTVSGRPRCLGSLSGLVQPTLCHSTFPPYTASASEVLQLPTEMQYINNLNVHFVFGNKSSVKKLHPLFPTFMNLAFKICIRQCLFEFPLMLTHGNMLKWKRTSMVKLLCRDVQLILYH